jgi:hypothetical protein
MTRTTALVIVALAAMTCLTIATVAAVIAQRRTPAGMVAAHNTLARQVTTLAQQVIALEDRQTPPQPPHGHGTAPRPSSVPPGVGTPWRAVTGAGEPTRLQPTIPRGTE